MTLRNFTRLAVVVVVRSTCTGPLALDTEGGGHAQQGTAQGQRQEAEPVDQGKTTGEKGETGRQALMAFTKASGSHPIRSMVTTAL